MMKKSYRFSFKGRGVVVKMARSAGLNLKLAILIAMSIVFTSISCGNGIRSNDKEEWKDLYRVEVKELLRIGSDRHSGTCRTASLSSPTSIPAVTWLCPSPRAWCRSSARSTATAASSSMAPNFTSAGSWSANTSWRHSRRIIGGSSSSTKGNSSKHILSPSQEKLSSLSAESISVCDILTVPSIKNP